MRIVGNIISVVLVLFGIVWASQGSGIWAGTVMSATAAGPSMWLWIGIVIGIVGLVGIWWFNFRRR